MKCFQLQKQNVHRENDEILKKKKKKETNNIHGLQNQIHFKSELRNILSAKTDQISRFVLQVRKLSRLLSA